MKVVNNGLTITIDGTMGHFPKEFVVSALEKQIPKRVINATCPTCNARNSIIDYCAWCGQALDWSDE